MKFLLTNDDGIEAPGLQALEKAARGFGDVTVVAPASPYSGCGHQVTTHTPLRVEKRGPDRYAVAGTPADCVRMALHELAPRIDWVLSGINAGGNLGADTYISGTVAAVREGVLHGWPGIALSQYRRKDIAFDWDRSAAWTATLLRDLLAQPWRRGSFWNVNLPHLDPQTADPTIIFCPLDPQPLPVSYCQEGELYHYNGDYHERRRESGSDVDVCFNGQIAITQVTLW